MLIASNAQGDLTDSYYMNKVLLLSESKKAKSQHKDDSKNFDYTTIVTDL